MSGQESIRGYLFQSLIAVLNSLNKDWATICIEPKTLNDKIDIIWTFDDNEKVVCQVKSSINNFGKNDILRWLEGLRNDNKNAKKYVVHLIGNSASSTKKFFNGIGSKSESDFPEEFKELFPIKNKIQVDLDPNNIETLEYALISKLDEFLFTKEILTDYPTKKLIANGMVNQIIKISTNGKSITKKQFEDNLLEWLTFNYAEQISSDKANFELSYYLSNRIKFQREINVVRIPDIISTDLYKRKKMKIQKLFTKISKFNFDVKTFEKPIDFTDIDSVLSLSITNPFEYDDKPVVVNSYELKNLSKSTLKILQCKPDKEFFNFGNLKESKKMGTIGFFNDKISYKGSDKEKEKRKHYDEYYWRITELSDLLNFWKKVSKSSVLPIVVTNKSLTNKESIKIQLLFPKEVKIYKSKKFPIPKRLQILKDFNSNDSYLFKNLKHTQDSIVNEYYQGYPMHERIDLSILGNQSKEFERDKFRDKLDYHFDFKYYYDDNKYTIIECEIDELNTNQSISLPSYIFVRSKMDFKIEYRITCKNEPETIKGSLSYKSNNEQKASTRSAD